MAVVLKSKGTESTTPHVVGAPTFFNTFTHKISNPAQVAAGNILQNLAMASYHNISNNILFKMNCKTKVEKN